jgi:hypothetical protein
MKSDNEEMPTSSLAEVVLGPFLSASSSLLDPCLTCCRCYPCGPLRAIFARAYLFIVCREMAGKQQTKHLLS